MNRRYALPLALLALVTLIVAASGPVYRFATQAEVNDGASTATMVSPATLASWTGVSALPAGLTNLWRVDSTNAAQTVATNAAQGVVASASLPAAHLAGSLPALDAAALTNLTIPPSAGLTNATFLYSNGVNGTVQERLGLGILWRVWDAPSLTPLMAVGPSLLVGYTNWAVSTGNRLFRHDDTHTIVSNSATLTATEWTDGTERHWFNGKILASVNKSNGAVAAAAFAGDASGLTNYPTTNLIGALIYGDGNHTNAVYIGPTGEVLSNANGRVDIAGGNITASGTITANGSGLTNLDAAQLATGTIPMGRVATNTASAGNFLGSASGSERVYFTNLLWMGTFLRITNPAAAGSFTDFYPTTVTNASLQTTNLFVQGGQTNIGWLRTANLEVTTSSMKIVTSDVTGALNVSRLNTFASAATMWSGAQNTAFTNGNIGVSGIATATNGFARVDTATFPTNSVPAGSATVTNVLCIQYKGRPYIVATNYASTEGWQYWRTTDETWQKFTP